MTGPAAITPEQAKIVWNSLLRPTTRRVARALSLAGRSVSHETIRKWKNANWAIPPGTRGPPVGGSRSAYATDNVAALASILTGDAEIQAQNAAQPVAKLAISVFVPEPSLLELDDASLRNAAVRATFLAVATMQQKLVEQADRLILNHPKEAGELAKNLSVALQAAIASEAGAKRLNSDNANLGNGNDILGGLSEGRSVRVNRRTPAQQEAFDGALSLWSTEPAEGYRLLATVPSYYANPEDDPLAGSLAAFRAASCAAKPRDPSE